MDVKNQNKQTRNGIFSTIKKPLEVLKEFLLCCSHEVAPTPVSYLFKYDFDAGQNSLEIFLPAGSLNCKYN